jgi:putative transposase
MIINRAYKTELNPNNKQKTILNKSFGIARFAYNWGLNQRIELYKSEKKSTNAINQHKLLNTLKSTEYPWMYEVSKCVPQESLRNLHKAFGNFFRGLKSGKKIGFPHFKSKHRSRYSFRISSGFFYVTNSSIKIPNCGEIKLKEKGYIPVENIKYNSITISKEADKYFVSVQVVIEIKTPKNKPESVMGIDLGVKTLLVCSNGDTFDNPKNTNRLEKKLAHAQKNFSRTKKGSKNRDKRRLVVQKVHRKIRNRRFNHIHQITNILTKTKSRYLVIEDLNVAGMMKNHCLAKAIQDGSFGEIQRQLEYKSQWRGSEVILVNRYFPSSKMCRKCGQIKEDLTLSDRIFECECGHIEDRDLNASINLESYGLSTLSSRGIKACRESVRPLSACGSRAVSEKQESNDGSIRDGRFV